MHLKCSGGYPFLISSFHFKYDFKSPTGFVAKKEAMQRLSYAEASFFSGQLETSTLNTVFSKLKNTSTFNKMVAIIPSNDENFSK